MFTTEDQGGPTLLGQRERDKFQVLVPPNMRWEIVQQIHGLAHRGKKPMAHIIKATYIWPNMTMNIHTYMGHIVPIMSAGKNLKAQ
jgi:hypothetical protein